MQRNCAVRWATRFAWAVLVSCLCVEVVLAEGPRAEDCGPMIFVKRQHFDRPFGIGSIIGWNIYKPGGGIYVYDPRRPEREAREIFRRDDGLVFDMSLSFDARKVLFAWRRCKGTGEATGEEVGCFHIYEMNVDGSGLRQLTHGPFQDIHPFYLPDGRIGFVSTRVKCFTMCQPGAGCALHVMEPDGSNIRRIHFGTLADFSPYVLDNGLLNEAHVRNFRPLESGSRVSRLVELIEAGHGDVNVDDESRRKIYTWIEANVPYYGTYDHTRPGLSGSRDAVGGTKWFVEFQDVYRRRCGACHANDFYVNNSGRHHTWLNLTHPAWSRVLHAPLPESAGGLALCKAKDGKGPRLFIDKNDPDYTAMLRAIRQGQEALHARPRMDMKGAVPVPYPTNYAGPYEGFAGP